MMVGMGTDERCTEREWGQRLGWEGDRRTLTVPRLREPRRINTMLEDSLRLEDTLLLATITRIVSIEFPFSSKKGNGAGSSGDAGADFGLPSPLQISCIATDYDPQDSYQQTTYPPQHQQPQDPYYQAQPRSPHPDQYGNPHPSTSPYSATSGPNVIAGVWNPPRQQQPYQTSTSPQQQQGYASPPNNNAYSPDPRSAMQHNFASPPPPNPQAPINQDAYASDAYGGYAPQQPASPVNNVYAPSPQRLVPQHPASFTPGGHDSREESGASSGSVYYDASAGQASGSGGGGGAGVVEPPSYELSSIAPGQTDVASGSSSGFPREKGGYQPGAGR